MACVIAREFLRRSLYSVAGPARGPGLYAYARQRTDALHKFLHPLDHGPSLIWGTAFDGATQSRRAGRLRSGDRPREQKATAVCPAGGFI